MQTREKMQARVFDSGLHALAALLHSHIGQAHDDDGGQAVRIIHFDFDDDAFQPDHGARENASKHGESVDEAGGNVKQKDPLRGLLFSGL